MNRLPEPPARQPHAPQAGQPTPEAITAAADLAAAVEAIYAQPTSYRDPTPIPAIGPTPPVPQPGRPPMSQKAVDDSTRMISAGFLTICAGGAASGVLYFSGHADPTVVATICAAPAALAIPILALSRLIKKAKETLEAAPPVIHQHYEGTVHQDHRTMNTQTRGIWATTHNQLPK
ncbi:hypothetical protein [Streptomyces mexicanus]|uniref:hypothetical protein n=1 Tax=Streptomyces mexicanus TaxID=178566 RepID=UPI003668427C